MNQGLKHLAQQLTGGADLTVVSADELDVLIDEYPYFSALHLLKAAKAAGSAESDATPTLSKAAIYFPNPHWFYCILEEMKLGAAPAIAAPSANPDMGTEDIREEILVEESPEAEVVNVVGLVEEQEMVVEEPEPLPEDNKVEAEESIQWENNLAENPVYQQHVVSDEEHFEQELWQRQEWAEEKQPEMVEEEKPVLESPSAIIPEIEEPDADQILRSEIDVESKDQPIIVSEESETVHETEKPIEEPEMESTAVAPASVEKAEEPAFDLPFEPLHTIDYFASQGIKIPAEASPKDQLTLKLRSFTEWLRAMKKLHPEKMAREFKPEEEDQVRSISESSNASSLVFTEAMAEVFLKQGKKDKALEVYEKLSLLDPAKSAYFAVRIQEIKEN